MKFLSLAIGISALALSTTAHADNLALAPVGATASAAIAEVAASGVLSPAVAAMVPVTGFFYLTFETKYKPFEAVFGKEHVFYEYPERIRG